MRLSDIKGDRAFDVIADIVDPVAAIAQDENVKAMFKRTALPEGVNARDFVIERIRKGLPSLLRKHKNELVTILAAIADVSPDEYVRGLSLAKLLADCYELLTDDTFIGLFTSAQSDQPSSGSAPENTEVTISEVSDAI